MLIKNSNMWKYCTYLRIIYLKPFVWNLLTIEFVLFNFFSSLTNAYCIWFKFVFLSLLKRIRSFRFLRRIFSQWGQRQSLIKGDRFKCLHNEHTYKPICEFLRSHQVTFKQFICEVSPRKKLLEKTAFIGELALAITNHLSDLLLIIGIMLWRKMSNSQWPMSIAIEQTFNWCSSRLCNDCIF